MAYTPRLTANVGRTLEVKLELRGLLVVNSLVADTPPACSPCATTALPFPWPKHPPSYELNSRKLALLQSKLQLLAEKRRSILRKLDAVIYPVNTLPSDIMAEIFMHYVDKSLIQSVPSSLNTDSPLRLASVCSAWRRVALSFPRLWAVLRLSWCPLSVTGREKLLHCWLSRAGGCLLDLQLKGRDLTPAISDAIAHYAPQLRSLTLGPYLGSQLSQFAAAPQLRKVSFSASDPSWAKLPWNQITSLDLLHRTPSLEVLKAAPNLEMLSLRALDSDNDSEEFDDGQTLVPIVMTKLHTLIIYPSSSSSNCSIFDHLALPALRTLELGGDLNIEQLGALIGRSACTLTEMHLHDQTAVETIGYLNLSESIERLTIELGDDWRERFMEEEDADAENTYCLELFGFFSSGRLPALKALSFDEFPMTVDAYWLQPMLGLRREGNGAANFESFRLGLNIHIEWPAGQTP
ncbi:hypothetical protein C8J57DRAFT_1728321 [Mycena rebaudengoi]|nr:hypothetical protein C8J57DRAFT_1728321 [Mycena rebaudengoi]